MEKLNHMINAPLPLTRKQNRDSRGLLSAYEVTEMTGVKFERYFVISNITGGQRGGHAHKYTHQVIDCVSGSFILNAMYSGCKYRFELNAESPAVFTPAMTWVEMNDITEDCSILVISSDRYNIENSIRTIDEYNTYCQTIN